MKCGYSGNIQYNYPMTMGDYQKGGTYEKDYINGVKYFDGLKFYWLSK